MGRPGLPPGVYFRLLLIGYFEGIDAERGIAGVRPIRWLCGIFWVWRWTTIRRTIRRLSKLWNLVCDRLALISTQIRSTRRITCSASGWTTYA
jgi:hypothetical protein